MPGLSIFPEKLVMIKNPIYVPHQGWNYLKSNITDQKLKKFF